MSLHGLLGHRVVPLRAVQLWGAVDVLRRAIEIPRPPREQAEYEQAVVALRSTLGDAAFDAAWAEGLLLPLEEAVALAQETESGG
jgi:hypothetical protein